MEVRSWTILSLACVASSAHLPTVFLHGMGDSCFNSGMAEIAKATGAHVGSYSVCIPTGPDQGSDTNNGFFMTMKDNLEAFAKAVKKDPKLAGGFNAIGFSQGNLLIRGYIQKYNDPPVSTWLSVHGCVVGVASFPNCDPKGLLGPVCGLLDRLVVGPAAYTNFMQHRLFQADYFRDPRQVNSTEYKANSELAQWNNEGDAFENSYAANFAKTQRFVMIKALEDSMIYPNEGEWWGALDADKNVLKMKDTEWYKKDLFGLKTADEAGKIVFNSTKGNHLQFSEEDLFGWIDQHFIEMPSDSEVVV